MESMHATVEFETFTQFHIEWNGHRYFLAQRGGDWRCEGLVAPWIGDKRIQWPEALKRTLSRIKGKEEGLS